MTQLKLTTETKSDIIREGEAGEAGTSEASAVRRPNHRGCPGCKHAAQLIRREVYLTLARLRGKIATGEAICRDERNG